MNPLSPAVSSFLALESPERRAALAAWFSRYPTFAQDLMLERVSRGRSVAVDFSGERQLVASFVAEA